MLLWSDGDNEWSHVGRERGREGEGGGSKGVTTARGEKNQKGVKKQKSMLKNVAVEKSSANQVGAASST